MREQKGKTNTPTYIEKRKNKHTHTHTNTHEYDKRNNYGVLVLKLLTLQRNNGFVKFEKLSKAHKKSKQLYE